MPARGDLTMEQLTEETNASSGSEFTGMSSEDEDTIINNVNVKYRVATPTVKIDVNHERFESLPIRSVHETFLRNCIDEILNSAVFNATDRSNKVVEFKNPEILGNILDLKLKATSDSDEKLLELLKDTIKYSVKTGHPYFVNQLFSSVDPYALAGQWLTDALNPSVYTYEVSPVFTVTSEYFPETKIFF